ncbi:MAG: hypothetical protein KDI51_00390 [Xanthomonadales bacterium]|nr:hypothetical protein [Xanthomonadales bacterium]
MKHKSVDFSPRRQLVLLAASLALLFSSLSRADVSHGWHDDPDIGDLLGNGASFDLVSPWGTGVIAFENDSDADVKMKVSQGEPGEGTLITAGFGMRPGASICITYKGNAHFDVGGDGHIKITQDSTIADPVPDHCHNYFGLTGSGDDTASKTLETLKGIYDIAKAIGG